MTPTNLNAILATLDEPWAPRTVMTVNEYDVRLFKARDEFTRHSHPETDEFFLVLEGRLTIRLDADDVILGPGDAYVVPRGVTHQPVSDGGASVMLFEPRSTINTGDTPGKHTAPRRVQDEIGSANTQ